MDSLLSHMAGLQHIKYLSFSIYKCLYAKAQIQEKKNSNRKVASISWKKKKKSTELCSVILTF